MELCIYLFLRLEMLFLLIIIVATLELVKRILDMLCSTIVATPFLLRWIWEQSNCLLGVLPLLGVTVSHLAPIRVLTKCGHIPKNWFQSVSYPSWGCHPRGHSFYYGGYCIKSIHHPSRVRIRKSDAYIWVRAKSVSLMLKVK